MIRASLMAAGLTFALTGVLVAADKPVLNIYTYDSFVSEWGPGPLVEAAFEETCGCDLQFTTAGDGAALLARLKLEAGRSKADVVLGLDNNLIAQAMESALFVPHGIKTGDLSLPVVWDDPVFVPYDWGYFAFVYDSTKLKRVPRSFRMLAAAPDDLKIIIQDPRSSTPGLGLLMWVEAAYGDEAKDIWAGLAPHVLTVTKGWSEAYGLFLDGEADMVLSYTTSPAYHRIAEGDTTKAAAMFDEGHYLQIEVAAKLAASPQPALADQFLTFMLSDAFQSLIPTTNWMYPARLPQAGLPEGFADSVADHPAGALLITPAEVAALRDKALGEWLTALSQ
jgi:thiamine transport system substrate-binding protein